MTTGLLELARAGDEEAFRELLEPYWRELEVHCCRMLGSFTDAEDVMQEALLAAWQGLGGFEGRRFPASVLPGSAWPGDPGEIGQVTGPQTDAPNPVMALLEQATLTCRPTRRSAVLAQRALRE